MKGKIEKFVSSHYTIPPTTFLSVCCFHGLVKENVKTFFIRQSNVSRVKVVGQRLTALFDQRFALYCNGIPCLLLSPAFGKYIRTRILNRTLISRKGKTDGFKDLRMFTETNFDGEFAVLGMNKKEFVRSISFIEQLQNMTLSSVQTATKLRV